MNRLYRSLAFALIVILPLVAIAQDSDETLSGNGVLTPGNQFRNLPQTDTATVLPGGLDYAYDRVLFPDNWTASINLTDNLELDVYRGYSREFVNDLGYDLTAIYYRYPMSGSGLSYSFGSYLTPTLGAGFLKSDDWSLDRDDSLYVYGDLGVTLPMNIDMGLQIGRQSSGNVVVTGTSDWLYNFSLTKSLMGLDFSLSYSDTYRREIDCTGLNGNLTAINACDRRLIFSIKGGF